MGGWVAISLFLLVSYRVVFWGVVQSSGEYRCLLSNNLGDSCLHLSLVNALALGGEFWPVSPWFASEPLSYPPGPDMLDAMLVSMGHGVLESLHLTGALFSTLTALMLWAWGGSWAVLVFLLGGSWFASTELVGVDLPYTAQWKNLFLNIFASQRGMQMAIPVGLLMLMACRKFARHQEIAYFYLAALLLSTLPFTSVHSVLALTPILVITSVFGAPRRTLPILVVSLVLAIVSCWYVGALGKASAIRFAPFLPPHEFASLSAWLLNYGLWLPLVAWVSIIATRELGKSLIEDHCRQFAWKSEDSWNRASFLYFVLLFIGASLISISPWTWDNTKLMLWSVIGTSAFIWSVFLKPYPWYVRAVILALVILPSVPSVVSEISIKNKGHRLFSAQEYNEALSARNFRDPIKCLAASPEYNHPWLAAGHPFLVGYSGWLWSHGLDYKEKHRNLEKILKGGPGWESLAINMRITHLLWGPREKASVKRTDHPAELLWEKVSEGTSGTLYKRN